MKGLIVKGIAGFYYVRTESGIFQCKARGIFKKQGIIPTVGDTAAIEVQEDGDAVINSIDERKNEFIRPQISNVDCFIVVIATANPKPNFLTVDRFLTMAEKSRTEAIICINKVDIAEKTEIQKIKDIYRGIYPVICTSAISKDGVAELKSLLKNEKYAFAGPSGAGKSTLLNTILPSANVETGEMSRKTLRGRHTTRHNEIFEIEGGAMVYDTPGFTSFEAGCVYPDELMHLYPEIAKLYGKCQYKNCDHIKGKGCAVRDAVKTDGIHKSRYDSYREIYNEIKGNRR